MARWLLEQPHYLNVPGTQWEYKEIDRTTGKQGRKVYNVPLFLDPNNPGDHNSPEGVIVAHEGSRFPNDIIFVGDPTPDMRPLDEEAEKISASFMATWKHPINDLPSNGDYAASLITAFENQIATLIRLGKAEPANPVSQGSIDPEAFKQLQEQVAALTAANAQLQQQAQNKPARRA